MHINLLKFNHNDDIHTLSVIVLKTMIYVSISIKYNCIHFDVFTIICEFSIIVYTSPPPKINQQKIFQC